MIRIPRKDRPRFRLRDYRELLAKVGINLRFQKSDIRTVALPPGVQLALQNVERLRQMHAIRARHCTTPDLFKSRCFEFIGPAENVQRTF